MVNRRCQRKAVGAIGIQGQGKDGDCARHRGVSEISMTIIDRR
ncbi:Uncharacterised protein [Vibrio cholerae]|nr:Uncharacterised protein [Vibrio cholerae]CSI08935.1 Uncharacterised protein [Vibrio cholerae]CSI66885.1 Uncharacterised protein [Vibrio cholerae]